MPRITTANVSGSPSAGVDQRFGGRDVTATQPAHDEIDRGADVAGWPARALRDLTRFAREILGRVEIAEVEMKTGRHRNGARQQRRGPVALAD